VLLNSPDPTAANELVARLYDELRALARAHLRRERSGHTLDTTGLVNEAYLRLAVQSDLGGVDRARFFAIASTTMRRVLVDYARRRKRQKRGGGEVPIPLEEAEALLTEAEADELLALDGALERFETINPRGCAVVRHRFFAGLSLEETADLLQISSKTVQREWIAARAWLRKEVARDLDLLDQPG
jgi:RNA polymerase sigma factor (TIGR02999 family)